MDNLVIAMALSILFQTIKNPQRKADLRAALLKLRNQINAAYAGDPDFS